MGNVDGSIAVTLSDEDTNEVADTNGAADTLGAADTQGAANTRSSAMLTLVVCCVSYCVSYKSPSAFFQKFFLNSFQGLKWV